MTQPTANLHGSVLAAALIPLACPAVYLGAHGLANFWLGHAPILWTALFLPLSIGWHAAWLTAATRSTRQTWIAPAWLASVDICRRGLVATGFDGTPAVWALIIETTLLGVALQFSPGVPLSERLARWRRAADDLSAQLATFPGVIPWVRNTFRLAFRGGTAGRPAFSELVTAVRDADARLGAHLSHAVLPEQVRESLLTRARDLESQAELASIETGMLLEHQALAAAVTFRDECRRLEHLTEVQRDAIARNGQAFLLECAGVPARTFPQGERTA